MDLMQLLAAIPGAGPAIPYVALGVSVAAAAATALPKPSGPGTYATIYGIVNAIGFNFGRAKNQG